MSTHTDAKHTPTLATPLESRKTAMHGHSLFDANGSSLAIDFEQHTLNEIVRRCNSHDALVAAIEKSVSTLQRIEYDTVRMGPTVCAEVCADLRAALKAAKGEA